MYEGREYDFVFSVEIDDEGRSLKLPYNRNEDPWQAAQNFVTKHALPQSQLEEVATFIIKSGGGGGGAPVAAAAQYRDPFTGGSSYIPDGAPSATARSGGDPFTSSGRYVPPSSTSSSSSSGDPFTSSGAYVPGSSSSSSSSSSSAHFPLTSVT